MLEKFGVHISGSVFLGAGAGAGNMNKLKSDTGINDTGEDFYTTAVELPKEMALILVLAQNSNSPVQAQTQTRTGKVTKIEIPLYGSSD